MDETRRAILDRALRAANEATKDAGRHTASSRCEELLNEQWVQSYVGIAINDLLRDRYVSEETFVSFETSVSWLEDFISRPRGAGCIPGKLRDRQRFDITVWSKGGSVAGLIEIKDQPILSARALSSDPKKICDALRRWPSLRWGMFLFSVRSSESNRYSSRRAEVEAKSNKYLGQVEAHSGCVKDYTKLDNSLLAKRGGALGWCAVMFTYSSTG